MYRYMKYFIEGIQKSIIVGIPDFSTNNQFTDMQNIKNDLNIAMRRTIEETNANSKIKQAHRDAKQ